MKILIGVDKGSYTFNATGKTVTLSGIYYLSISQILLITNLTSNEIIYSPVISGKGGSISNNVISLDFDTSSMNNSDDLQIFVDMDDTLKVKISDEGLLDAFGRLKISSPNTIFRSSHTTAANNTIWENSSQNGGTFSFLTFSSMYSLQVTGSSGSRAIRTQHGYNEYVPGKSQTIFESCLFGASESGLTRRVGYYNDTDGIFYEQKDGIIYAVLRSSSSGSIVENRFTQSNWNIDRLDGSLSKFNKSGHQLDLSKVQILQFDFQWLGVGRVRYGFNIDGELILTHQIDNANIIDKTYMSSGSLPIRYEILRTNNIGTTASLNQICSTVISGGGDANLARSTSFSLGSTSRTVTAGTRTSLICIRQRLLTLNNKINRTKAYPRNISIMTTSNSSALVEIVLQRSNLSEVNLGGTPTWNTSSNSLLEYSVNGTTVSGGTLLKSFYISAQGRESAIDFNTNDDFLSLNDSGTQSDYLHVIITPLGANATLYASIDMIETR